MKKQMTNQQLRVRVNVRAGDFCYRVQPQEAECKNGCSTPGCRKLCEKKYPMKSYWCQTGLH